MFDKGTLSELGGWTGYRVADLEYRPGEGWMGRDKLLIRSNPSRKGDALLTVRSAEAVGSRREWAAGSRFADCGLGRSADCAALTTVVRATPRRSWPGCEYAAG